MNTEREMFEKWVAADPRWDLERNADGSNYSYAHPRAAWKGWQAALAARAGEQEQGNQEDLAPASSETAACSKEPHPLAGLHINQGSMDAAADQYEAEYLAEKYTRLLNEKRLLDQARGAEQTFKYYCSDAIRRVLADTQRPQEKQVQDAPESRGIGAVPAEPNALPIVAWGRETRAGVDICAMQEEPPDEPAWPGLPNDGTGWIPFTDHRVATAQIAAAREALSAPVQAIDREFLGRMVRTVWVEWAKEQPNPKASWLQPWEALTEPEREVDRRIGERIATIRSSAPAVDRRERPLEPVALQARVELAERTLLRNGFLSCDECGRWFRIGWALQVHSCSGETKTQGPDGS